MYHQRERSKASSQDDSSSLHVSDLDRDALKPLASLLSSDRAAGFQLSVRGLSVLTSSHGVLARRRSAPAVAEDAPVDSDEIDNDMEVLQSRIEEVERGIVKEAVEKKLYEVVTDRPPYVLLGQFFDGAPEEVARSMRETVAQLYGQLPQDEFSTTFWYYADRLSALMLQLQLCGYMLRNAHYVKTLRLVLRLTSGCSPERFREAFDKIDLDGSGTIETNEIDKLLGEVYGNAPPEFEVETLQRFLDANGDGTITFEEFYQALGPAAERWQTELLPSAESEIEPQVSGPINLTLENGTVVEIDGAEHIAELRSRASTMRSELAELLSMEAKSQEPQTLTMFINSLSKERMQGLTSEMTEPVQTVMQRIVQNIVFGEEPNSEGMSDEVQEDEDEPRAIDQETLQYLSMYMLVVGYRLREAEAKKIGFPQTVKK